MALRSPLEWIRERRRQQNESQLLRDARTATANIDTHLESPEERTRRAENVQNHITALRISVSDAPDRELKNCKNRKVIEKILERVRNTLPTQAEREQALQQLINYWNGINTQIEAIPTAMAPEIQRAENGFMARVKQSLKWIENKAKGLVLGIVKLPYTIPKYILKSVYKHPILAAGVASWYLWAPAAIGPKAVFGKIASTLVKYFPKLKEVGKEVSSVADSVTKHDLYKSSKDTASVAAHTGITTAKSIWERISGWLGLGPAPLATPPAPQGSAILKGGPPLIAPKK